MAIYIRRDINYTPYTPSSSTVVYMPFKDSNDTPTGSGINTYQKNDITYSGACGGVATGGSLGIRYASNGQGYGTMSIWFNGTVYVAGGGDSYTSRGYYPKFSMNATSAEFYDSGRGYYYTISYEKGWHNIVINSESNSDGSSPRSVYLDGVFKTYIRASGLTGNSRYYGGLSGTGQFSEWIVESGNRDAAKIKQYFDSTKQRYLS